VWAEKKGHPFGTWRGVRKGKTGTRADVCRRGGGTVHDFVQEKRGKFPREKRYLKGEEPSKNIAINDKIKGKCGAGTKRPKSFSYKARQVKKGKEY